MAKAKTESITRRKRKNTTERRKTSKSRSISNLYKQFEMAHAVMEGGPVEQG
jgi:hypothetical protein